MIEKKNYNNKLLLELNKLIINKLNIDIKFEQKDFKYYSKDELLENRFRITKEYIPITYDIKNIK